MGKQDLLALKSVARTEPDVFFSAGMSIGKYVHSPQTVIYDVIYSNEAAAYDNKTGIFTAPIDGFYKFEMYVISTSDDAVLTIQVNGVDKVEASCYGDDYNAAANSLTTRLTKGDKVDVISKTHSYLHFWDSNNGI